MLYRNKEDRAGHQGSDSCGSAERDQSGLEHPPGAGGNDQPTTGRDGDGRSFLAVARSPGAERGWPPRGRRARPGRFHLPGQDVRCRARRALPGRSPCLLAEPLQRRSCRTRHRGISIRGGFGVSGARRVHSPPHHSCRGRTLLGRHRARQGQTFRRSSDSRGVGMWVAFVPDLASHPVRRGGPRSSIERTDEGLLRRRWGGRSHPRQCFAQPDLALVRVRLRSSSPDADFHAGFQETHTSSRAALASRASPDEEQRQIPGLRLGTGLRRSPFRAMRGLCPGRIQPSSGKRRSTRHT